VTHFLSHACFTQNNKKRKEMALLMPATVGMRFRSRYNQVPYGSELTLIRVEEPDPTSSPELDWFHLTFLVREPRREDGLLIPSYHIYSSGTLAMIYSKFEPSASASPSPPGDVYVGEVTTQ
jgi:hypothetical protein